MSIERLLLGLILSAFIAGLGYWRQTLNSSGVFGAILVGTLIFGLGGWIWGLLLITFFVSSSWLSYYRRADKEAVAERFAKGSRRDLGQALANGGLGAILAIVFARYPEPFLFAGVTRLGIWSSVAGALLIGAVATALTQVFSLLNGNGWSLQASTYTLLAVAGGLAGSLFDSLLGATMQGIYYCEHCAKETESPTHHCGQTARPLRGWGWLNNDVVNFSASMVGGLVAASLAWILWR
jgi:uncharacterized membrane protein